MFDCHVLPQWMSTKQEQQPWYLEVIIFRDIDEQDLSQLIRKCWVQPGWGCYGSMQTLQQAGDVMGVCKPYSRLGMLWKCANLTADWGCYGSVQPHNRLGMLWDVQTLQQARDVMGMCNLTAGWGCYGSVQPYSRAWLYQRVRVHVWTKYLGLILKMTPKILYQSLDPKCGSTWATFWHWYVTP